MKQQNQFTDRFRFLTTVSAQADTLRQSVNRMLSRVLPQRVLSKTNIFELTLNVVMDIFNLSMFYTEDAMIESNILVAQNETSVRGLAELSGHSATRPQASYGTVKVSLLPGVQAITPAILLENTTFRCNTNNLVYSLSDPGITSRFATTTQSFTLNLVEGVWNEQTFVSDGSALFSVNLNDLQTIDNDRIIIYVDSILYTRSLGLNDMTSSSSTYLLRNGLTNQVDIVFGDGVHGIQPPEGASIRVKYLTTNGGDGNLDTQANTATFSFQSGVFDANGNDIDLSELANVSYDSNFALGSFGEHIDATRYIAGNVSRSSVFARPANLKAFLSKLTILSHIDVWTEEDDLIFNILALPNIRTKIATYTDYLNLSNSELALSTAQKDAISNLINTSESQLASSEIRYRDPTFNRYAAFVYVDASFNDSQLFLSKVENAICRFLVEETFGDVDFNNDRIISKSGITNAIFDLPEVNRVQLELVSEQNETARITGSYEKMVTVTNGSAKEQKVEIVQVPTTLNPNLGFTDLGDIQMGSRFNVPLLRGGFNRYNNVNAEGTRQSITLTKPIYIFQKVNNTWQELK